MRSFRFLSFLCLIALLVSVTPVSAVSSTTVTTSPVSLVSAPGPLFVNPDNGRYFTDGTIVNGKYKTVFLTGSHTWCNFMDCDNSSALNSPFDYAAYLDFLQSRNLNFFRLWRAENARGGEEGDNFWFDPMPYKRSTTCCAFDGKNKFDVTQFNQAYFDRMRQRVIDAGNRGIYVSIMLFDGWSVAQKDSNLTNHKPWKGHPFKSSNNINSVNGDPNSNGSGDEIQTLDSPETATQLVILPLEEAYVRKVIDTVNDLDNVLYEISNETESGSTTTDWQYHMIDYVKSYEAGKPKQHPVGMTAEWPGGDNADLFASSADWVSPNGDINNPPVADGSKVILSDTDHLCGICGNRKWVWKSFTRGENPIFMDPYDGAATGRGAPSGYDPNNSNDVSLRLNMGYARSYAQRINLATMTPTSNTSLCSTGYCLRNAVAEDAKYLIYNPTSGNITVNLSAVSAAKSLTVEWFNPSTGATTSGGTVNGGSSTLFTPPFSGDAVLFIYDLKSASPLSSIDTQDGWILESSETSGQGGTLNATATTLYVGDSAQDAQYRSFLSFDTSGLPDDAIVKKVQLQINVQAFKGGNMFTPTKTLGDLLVDIRKSYFGADASLVPGDFQASISKGSIGTLSSVPATGLYTITLKSTAFPFVNTKGSTQFRLRFQKDDNDDLGADYLKISSGNALSNKPQLLITYYMP